MLYICKKCWHTLEDHNPPFDTLKACVRCGEFSQTIPNINDLLHPFQGVVRSAVDMSQDPKFEHYSSNVLLGNIGFLVHAYSREKRKDYFTKVVHKFASFGPEEGLKYLKRLLYLRPEKKVFNNLANCTKREFAFFLRNLPLSIFVPDIFIPVINIGGVAKR